MCERLTFYLTSVFYIKTNIIIDGRVKIYFNILATNNDKKIKKTLYLMANFFYKLISWTLIIHIYIYIIGKYYKRLIIILKKND